MARATLGRRTAVAAALLVLAVATGRAAATPPVPPEPSAAPVRDGVVVFSLPVPLKDITASPEPGGTSVPPRLRFFLDARFLDRFVESRGKMVFLPHAEYRSLTEKKRQLEERLARQRRMAPAHAAILASGRLDVTVEDEAVRVKAVFKARLLAGTAQEVGGTTTTGGWKALPLVGGVVAATDFKATWPEAVLALRETVAGQTIGMEGPEGFFYVLTGGEGEGEVVLDLSVPITDDGAMRRFTMVLPDCPAMTMSVALKDPSVRVTIEPSIGLRALPPAQGAATRVTAGLRPGQAVTVSWHKRASRPTPAVSPSPGSTPIVRVRPRPRLTVERNLSLATIGEDSLTHASRIDLNVSLAQVEHVRLTKDEGLELTQLTGKDVVGPPRAVDDRSIAVHFQMPLQRRTSFVAVAEKRIPEKATQVRVRPLAVEGAERVKEGFIAVTSEVPLDLKWDPHASRDVTEILPTQLPEDLARGHGRPILMAFRHESPAAVLVLKVERFPPVPVASATITRLDVETYFPEPGQEEIRTRIEATVRSSADERLRLTFPPGQDQPEPQGIRVNGLVGRETKRPDGFEVRLLRSEPIGGAEGAGAQLRPYTVEFDLIASVPKPRMMGVHTVALPRMNLPVSRIRWAMHEPPAYAFHGYRAPLVGVDTPRDVFLYRWVRDTWGAVMGTMASLGALGLIVLLFVAWLVYVSARIIARGEGIPVSRPALGTLGAVFAVGLVVWTSSLMLSGGRVPSVLQKVSERLDTVGLPQPPPATRPEWADAAPADAKDAESDDAPEETSRRYVDKMGRMNRDERARLKASLRALQVGEAKKEDQVAGGLAPAAPEPALMGPPPGKGAPAPAQEQELVGAKKAGGADELRRLAAGGPRANPVALARPAGMPSRAFVRTFLYEGEGALVGEGAVGSQASALVMSVRYFDRRSQWLPSTAAAILGFGVFVVLCLATRGIVGPTGTAVTTLSALVVVGWIDHTVPFATDMALAAFGVPVLVLAGARLAGLALETYEGWREEAWLEDQRLSEAERARSAVDADRASRSGTPTGGEVPISQIFPETGSEPPTVGFEHEEGIGTPPRDGSGAGPGGEAAPPEGGSGAPGSGKSGPPGPQGGEGR